MDNPENYHTCSLFDPSKPGISMIPKYPYAIPMRKHKRFYMDQDVPILLVVRPPRITCHPSHLLRSKICGCKEDGSPIILDPTAWSKQKNKQKNIPGPFSLGAKMLAKDLSNQHRLGFNWHPLEGASKFYQYSIQHELMKDVKRWAYLEFMIESVLVIWPIYNSKTWSAYLRPF